MNLNRSMAQKCMMASVKQCFIEKLHFSFLLKPTLVRTSCFTVKVQQVYTCSAFTVT